MKPLTILALVGLASVGTARADDAGLYDPAQLPAFRGKVAQYDLSPRGVAGLILEDGTEVLASPALGSQIVFAVKPGDAVTVHGIKARNLPLVLAMSVANDASGVAVTSDFPSAPDGRGGMRRMTVQGKVKAQLHGARGEVNGVLLVDGAIIRLPPPAAERMMSELAPGASVVAEGAGTDGVLGRVLVARAIGPSEDHLTPVMRWHRPDERENRMGPRGEGRPPMGMPPRP